MSAQKIAFISGVARSGTSALVNLINTHPEILIGQERYYWLYENKTIQPQHFKRDRFLDIQTDDSHNSGGLPSGADTRFDDAKIVGDKFPNLFEIFPIIFDRFPAARHVYILRNPLSVVESYDARHQDQDDNWGRSYQQGMREWNESVRSLADLPSDIIKQFLVLEYEKVFTLKEETDRIFSFFELDAPPETSIRHIRQRFLELNQTKVSRRDDIRRFVGKSADWDSYRKVLTNNQ